MNINLQSTAAWRITYDPILSHLLTLFLESIIWTLLHCLSLFISTKLTFRTVETLVVASLQSSLLNSVETKAARDSLIARRREELREFAIGKIGALDPRRRGSLVYHRHPRCLHVSRNGQAASSGPGTTWDWLHGLRRLSCNLEGHGVLK